MLLLSVVHVLADSTIFGDVVGAMFPPSLFCVELRRSIVDVSTSEEPIDVKLAMLLHLPGRCVGRRSGSDRCECYYYAAIQLYANYAEGLHFSAFHYYCRYCGCPACVCVPVRSFCRHVHLDPEI